MEYATVRLPASLTDEADRMVREGRRGYRSRGEVVADALRRFLDAEANQAIAAVSEKGVA